MCFYIYFNPPVNYCVYFTFPAITLIKPDLFEAKSHLKIYRPYNSPILSTIQCILLILQNCATFTIPCFRTWPSPQKVFLCLCVVNPCFCLAPGNHPSAAYLLHQLGHCFPSSMANTEIEEVILSECPSIIGMWAGDRWLGQVISTLSASVGLVIADGLQAQK